MAKTPTMTVKLALDMKKFNKGISTAEQKMKSFGQSAVSAGKSISLGVTLPIVGLSAAMIKLSSDATETNNKFNEIFGKAAKQTGKDLDKLADSIGRDSVKLKEFAGDLGGVATSIGFTDKEAGELSKSMIKLGIDVGSFRNKSDDQVIHAFTSALVGEREALKSLGVAMLEADVVQEAYRMTGKKTQKELTKMDKALATQSLLYKLFRKDVGDAKRTQFEFANQMKTLSANISKVARTFGDELKPLANEFLLIINPMIKNFANLNKETKRYILITGAVVGALGPLLISLGLLSQALSFSLGGYLSMAKGISTVISKLVAWNTISKTVTTTTHAQTAAQKLLGGSTATTTTKIVKQSRVMLGFTKVTSALTAGFTALKTSIASLTFTSVVAGLKATSVAASGLIKRLALMSIPVAAVVVALALVVNAGMTVARHWDGLKMAAVDTFDGIVTAVSESVKSVKKWVVDKTKPIVDFAISAWNTLADAVAGSWNFILEAVGSSIKKMVSWIKDKLFKAINGMIKLYNDMVALFGGSAFITKFESFEELEMAAKKSFKATIQATKEFAGDVKGVAISVGAAIKESKPFETFVDETKKNMDQAKAIFEDTISKMTGFSFSMGGGEEQKSGGGGGDGDKSQIGFFEGLKNTATTAYDAIKLKMDEVKAKQQEMILQNQETINKFTEGWLGFSANFQGIVATMQQVTSTMFQMFAQGVADAFANVVFEGANMVEQLKGLAIQIGKAVIQMLIKIGIERAAQAVIGAAVAKTTGAAEVQTNVAKAFSGGVASMAAAPFPINLGAAAFGASMAALAAGGFAMLASGGITTGADTSNDRRGCRKRSRITIKQA